MSLQVGKLIVIDGIDGAGKTTQINLLSQYLINKNIPNEVISFPQYGKNEYARQITDYLEGKLGKLEEVDPYFIARAYALDRLTSKDLINSWLNEGKLVIANRYVSANEAHIGATVEKEKREEFIKWIDQLEYETNGMPKEDLTILLNIDPSLGQQNALGKNQPDIHEKDLKHLEEAAKIYLEISNFQENWVVINCMENGQMKSKQLIHKEIIEVLIKLK